MQNQLAFRVGGVYTHFFAMLFSTWDLAVCTHPLLQVVRHLNYQPLIRLGNLRLLAGKRFQELCPRRLHFNTGLIDAAERWNRLLKKRMQRLN